MSRRPDRASPIGPLKLLLVASVVVPALLFAAYAWLTYQAAFTGAELAIQRTAELAREHGRRVLEAQDQVAERANDLVRTMSEAEIRAAEAPLHAAVARIVDQAPGVSSVMLIGRDNHPLVSSGLFPAPHDLDFGGTDYIRGVAGGHDGTFIGSMQLGAVAQKPFLPMAHAARGSDGAGIGAIVVGVQPRVFEEFYATMEGHAGSGQQDIVWLARADGSIILRYPPRPARLPPAQPAASFLAHIRQLPEHGFYYAHATIAAGSSNALFAYEHVPGYALYVIGGRSVRAIVSDWALALVGPAAVGVPGTIVLFLVTLMVLRRTRQKEAALEQAEAEMHRREQAEAALLQRQRLDAVGQMTGGIAHDFNNLLMVIIGNVERLQKRAEDPAAVRKMAANALLGAKRGAEIVQKLLTFSRRRLVHPENVDMNRRLADFKPLIDQAAGGALVELELKAVHAVSTLDHGQFETAILNLVTNARDAMAGEGRITIATGDTVIGTDDRSDLAPGVYVRVTVADTGPGMDAETAVRAFEPFFTTKASGAGTGLGLSQVYGFAQQAGGAARIRTQPGTGTTVELLLPVSRARTVAEPPQEPAIAARGHDGEVVLVVDDDAAVRELTVETLRDLGYRAIAAQNAEAALERLRGPERVDLVFSDVVMPGGMNGLQLSREAQRMRPGLKVLLTSGYPASVLGGTVPAHVALLSKPFTQEQLAAQLRATLGEPSLRVAE